MNCPHHIQIFAAEPKSYRDLPVRLAEFGTVYRYEESGELNGLTRVRGFTQDDAHLFCTPEQVEDEFRSTLDLVQFVFHSLEFKDVEVRLSLRDASPKFAGDPKLWELAEGQLARVLTEMKLPYVAAKGEAAFYGPKVDFLVRDVLGRKWQLGTVQLDYVLPERFGLEYTGADGQKHRPVMIHRAPFGSMERFHRHPDRTFRRSIPALACAGAGGRAIHQRKVQRLRRGGCAGDKRSRLARRRGPRRGQDRGKDSPRDPAKGALYADRGGKRGAG